MIRLKSYVCGQWSAGEGPARPLHNPSTEEPLAETATGGLDLAAALAHAREVGGPSLRSLGFAERAALLERISRVLHDHRDEFLALSRDNNGATRGDAKFDVDGATATLAAYARMGKDLGDARHLPDGEPDRLGPGARYVGQHVKLPRPGVAVHVNAFNFPAWGAFEKLAPALLAGMPVVTKPATATALTTFRMAEVMVAEADLPPGAFSFLAGPAADLLDHLGPQDCLAFTGSADTAAMLRTRDTIVDNAVRVNVEADSLNAAVLGPDVTLDSDLWRLAVRNVVVDMTQKAGQKCTAIRRVLVPAQHADALAQAVAAELALVRVGNPTEKVVTMGPVATASQLRDVRTGIALLAEQARVVTGGVEPVQGIGAPEGKGWFVAPTLLLAADARSADKVHSFEVFGPCATILPYDGSAAEAAALVARGRGCLVSSAYSDDRDWLAHLLLHAGPWNGRLLLASSKVADQALPPGMVLPNQVHGGPGRAGGGEELGGLRALDFYLNRVALQGDAGLLRKLLNA